MLSVALKFSDWSSFALSSLIWTDVKLTPTGQTVIDRVTKQCSSAWPPQVDLEGRSQRLNSAIGERKPAGSQSAPFPLLAGNHACRLPSLRFEF